MVPPLILMLGMSANTSSLLVIFSFIFLEICCNTELCLQVRHPCVKALGHQFRTCWRLAPELSQRGHLSNFLYPHFFKLSGVFNEFVDDLTAKDSTPCGTLSIKLFHITQIFSSFIKIYCSVMALRLHIITTSGTIGAIGTIGTIVGTIPRLRLGIVP